MKTFLRVCIPTNKIYEVSFVNNKTSVIWKNGYNEAIEILLCECVNEYDLQQFISDFNVAMCRHLNIEYIADETFFTFSSGRNPNSITMGELTVEKMSLLQQLKDLFNCEIEPLIDEIVIKNFYEIF